jgi:arginine exporter protein ArgO
MKKKHKKKHKWGVLSIVQLAVAIISGFTLLMSRTPWSHVIIRSHGFLLTLLATLHIIEKILEARKAE